MANAHALWLGRDPGSSAEAKYITDLKLQSPDAWSDLFDTYHDKIRRLAWAELRSAHDAEDIASTVFLRAIHAIDSYVYRGTPIVSWLYQIARNVIKERRRTISREKLTLHLDDELLTSWDGGDRLNEGPEGMIRDLDLLNALSKLTREQRKVLTLIYISGFSVREVADILGKGKRAVYYIQARGLIRLKHHLEQT